MEFSAEMIASFLGGEVIGDKNIMVSSIGKIEEAKSGDLAFLSNPKYEHYIYETKASIVLVNKTFEPKEEIKATLVRVDDAYKAFAGLLDLYIANKPQKEGISPLASIAEGVEMGKDLYIGAYAIIEKGVKLGDNCKIYPHVYIGDNVKIGNNVTINAGAKIYEDCSIGSNIIIHSGAVIGADGFGFAPTADGFKKIPQIGNVIIEDNVEIGANTCIDRATMGSTVIKSGVKLDNLIQIGHNVCIGENTVAAAQVGVAGSTKIGANCMFGGQVGISGHLMVADNTQLSSQSGLSGHVKKSGQVLMGTPAFEAGIYRRAFIGFKNLPHLMNEIEVLKREIEELKKMVK